MGAEEFLNKNHFHLITDSKNTEIANGDIERAMQDYAELKCKELQTVVEKEIYTQFKYDYSFIDVVSVFNSINLNSFCK